MSPRNSLQAACFLFLLPVFVQGKLNSPTFSTFYTHTYTSLHHSIFQARESLHKTPVLKQLMAWKNKNCSFSRLFMK